MKITCLIDSLGSGGAQRQLVNLAIGFMRRGHQIQVFTYYPDDFYLPVLREHNIFHECIEVARPLERLYKFRNKLRRGEQNAVIAFLETPSLVAEFASFPVKPWNLVVGERNFEPDLKALKKYIPRLAHYQADFVVTNTYAAAERLKEVYPHLEKKISTIYNLVDLNLFSPLHKEHQPLTERKRLVVAASYIPRKNLDGLLNALTLLDGPTRERIKIEWYGGYQSEYFNECQRFINKNKLEDLISLNRATGAIVTEYHKADGVALFSHREGLPNVICEGLAVGKPVLCSAISDAKILVEPGVNGWLCNPESPASIASSLSEFANTEFSILGEMGANNRRKAEKLFDEDRIIDRYLELLSNGTN